MKSAPFLQFSALCGVLAAHVLALWLLNDSCAGRPAVTPPRLLSMEMVAPAPPREYPKPTPAAPAKPRQTEAKPTPIKTAPPTPRLQTSQTPIDTPAPAQAISAPAQPAASLAADAPKTNDKPAATGKPQAITEPLARGGYLNNPAPTYPSESQEDGEAGTVRLRVHVSAQGLPLDVSVQQSSGFFRLDRAALAAVKRWRFIPAKRGDESIAYTFIVPVEFSLKSIRS
ncbi:energy transducer TonB [Chromobacterium paludis]|uniref:Energy transducer TonB n=2 Tax=Chromobacterium paludis TaxID=2605945 RepID=A0A5C1DK97_9NEIS|nr:energy transducer TonB [Chromobacterium paludis]